MFNKIILVGNLTRDIELRYSQGGSSIAKSAIATTRRFTSNGERKEEVCFVDITFFGRSGEIANQYLRKGSKILVEGRLSFEQWVDQNGQKRSKHSVIVESMQMLDAKGGNPAMGQDMGQPQGYGANDYNAPAQGQPQSYQAPQMQQPSYEQQPMQQNNYGQANQGYSHQAAAQQSREMPSSNSIPEIDIDEDEIPF
ncbi:single-stranded DNA-binding protein [Sulfurimonas sp. C5]|uniref:single-stranded DNA-binding protein n=1 Tax=Sulfurimonas sp. C5 TaxID=3036947 RepID=UPI00245832E4|nr:single-stranded DNA-binding protein [Sulfurimonas sp. C5]MDH4945040.1 single-stranded DNA-binding protein [Sulfurimonas sp. C5]